MRVDLFCSSEKCAPKSNTLKQSNKGWLANN